MKRIHMKEYRLGLIIMEIPNLVEEGEVIYNDYVFSNRTKYLIQ